MKRIFTLKNLARGVGIIVGLLVLVIIAWMVVAGPVTVTRVAGNGFDSFIDDYTRFPGRELQASSQPAPYPEAAEPLDMPAGALADFGPGGDLDTILQANDTIAFVVIRGDEIVYERYWQDHTESSYSQAFSMSKSVTSVLIGMAIDDGILDGVDQRLISLVPELADHGLGEVTIHDLLTMTSGSNYVEDDNPFAEHVILNFTPRLEDRILTIRREADPGTVWRYKSGDNALLGLMLDRALGDETITAYAQRRLWEPLGMEYGGVWSIDHEGDGLEKTWCCLAAAARDFAKIGSMMQHAGAWNGMQIVSARWVAQSTNPQVPANLWPDDYPGYGLGGYGYQWWIGSLAQGDYLGQGKDGQYLYINPAREVVIVRLGWSQGGQRTGDWLALFQTIAQEN